MTVWIILALISLGWIFVTGRQVFILLKEAPIMELLGIHVDDHSPREDNQQEDMDSWVEMVRGQMEAMLDSNNRLFPLKVVALLCVLVPLVQLVTLIALFVLYHVYVFSWTTFKNEIMYAACVLTAIAWVDNMKLSFLYCRALWSYRTIEDVMKFLEPRFSNTQLFPFLTGVEILSLVLQLMMGLLLLQAMLHRI